MHTWRKVIKRAFVQGFQKTAAFFLTGDIRDSERTTDAQKERQKILEHLEGREPRGDRVIKKEEPWRNPTDQYMVERF